MSDIRYVGILGEKPGNRHKNISDDDNRLSQHENQIARHQKLISLSVYRK